MLRLNLATDYALRTLLYLGSYPGRVVATREVAEFYGISADHVSKVAQQLAHGGYVRAGRGRTGGLRLGRPAERISIGEVVELFEGPVTLLECVGAEDVCRIQPGCRLRRLLERVGAQVMRELKAATLAEMLGPEGEPLVQLAGLPATASPAASPAGAKVR